MCGALSGRRLFGRAIGRAARECPAARHAALGYTAPAAARAPREARGAGASDALAARRAALECAAPAAPRAPRAKEQCQRLPAFRRYIQGHLCPSGREQPTKATRRPPTL